MPFAQSPQRVQPPSVVAWADAGCETRRHAPCERLTPWSATPGQNPDASAMIQEVDSMEPDFRAGDHILFEPLNPNYATFAGPRPVFEFTCPALDMKRSPERRHYHLEAGKKMTPRRP